MTELQTKLHTNFPLVVTVTMKKLQIVRHKYDGDISPHTLMSLSRIQKYEVVKVVDEIMATMTTSEI